MKEAPPLLLLLSGIIDLIRPLSDTDGTRGFFFFSFFPFFFCSIARVDGGSRGGRSTVVKVRAGRGGERGGQVEWSLFPRGMTRCEGLHRDRGYTPVRGCVCWMCVCRYIYIYIYVVHARREEGGGGGGVSSRLFLRLEKVRLACCLTRF